MLTNEEFARLEAARVNSHHHRTPHSAQKRVLQLAFEHIEALSVQHSKALKLIESMIEMHKRSLCYRAPATIALAFARVRHFLGIGRGAR